MTPNDIILRPYWQTMQRIVEACQVRFPRAITKSSDDPTEFWDAMGVPPNVHLISRTMTARHTFDLYRLYPQELAITMRDAADDLVDELARITAGTEPKVIHVGYGLEQRAFLADWFFFITWGILHDVPDGRRRG